MTIQKREKLLEKTTKKTEKPKELKQSQTKALNQPITTKTLKQEHTQERNCNHASAPNTSKEHV